MRERLQEPKADARRGQRADKAGGDSAVLAKIAALPPSGRVIGKRLHAIIKANAPTLAPKTWYAMPAYAKDGKSFASSKCTEIQDSVRNTRLRRQGDLDEGHMRLTALALKELAGAEEARSARS
jgi:hypothetical protein